MPESDLQLLTRAALEAGPIAMKYWRGTPQIWEKPEDAGPVCEADLAVNDHLETMLRAARPDYGWLSEETPDDTDRLSHARQFIIDPIDGTRSFLDGNEGFSHSIAIAEAGRIIAAVVHLPALNMTYSAEEDGPALLNGQPIRPAEFDGNTATVLSNRASFEAKHWPDGHEGLKLEFRPSLAWRLCLVAEGRFDAALTVRPAWEWDIAAGCLIAERAGCVVTDQNGQPMQFNARHPQQNGLVIAPPSLHAHIMARLAP